MIQLRTKLKVIDNTGAKIVSCFKVLNGKSQRRAQLGDVILASVQLAKPHGQIKKKTVVRAVVLRQRAPFKRKDGTTIKFDDNAVAIVDDNNDPKGTKITGPVAREVRANGFNKIISLAQEVL